MEEDGHKVVLHVYDLSQGLARQLSTTFLGKAIDGIWHTGIVVYGYEYYFGGGIQHCPVGTTPYGKPVQVVELGVTHIPKDVFEDYLVEISPRFTMETYNLFKHNCNNFSNEVSQFLVSANIPDYIIQLPEEVMNSPIWPMIMPMIQQLETTLRVGAVPQAPQFRPNSTPAQSSTSKASVSTNTTSFPNVNVTQREALTVNSPVSPATMEAANAGTSTKAAESATLPGSEKKKITVNSSDSPATKEAANAGTPTKAAESATLPGSEKKMTEANKEASLQEVRGKVQEEICREFAAIMATGTLRASEAAALAARRVMERHGRLMTATPRS